MQINFKAIFKDYRESYPQQTTQLSQSEQFTLRKTSRLNALFSKLLIIYFSMVVAQISKKKRAVEKKSNILF